MIQELDYQSSREYLNKFYFLERPMYSDWYEAEEEQAKYIWKLLDNRKPIGFLSYKEFKIPNSKEFLYIVKIFVLKEYRGDTPILINNERVSQVLFRELERKNINIITLESADEKLDNYYKRLGFIENQDYNNIFSSIIGKNRDIMVKINSEEILSNEEKELLGKL